MGTDTCMRIPLIDNIIMTSDSCNIILNREVVCDTDTKTRKKGEKYLNQFAFYANVAQALSGCLNLKVKESTAQDIKTLLREHRELVQHFDELFKTTY